MSAPTAFAYQWNRGGSPISGAIAQAYTLVSADLGAIITCTVTASNTAGASIPVNSAATATITAGGGTVNTELSTPLVASTVFTGNPYPTSGHSSFSVSGTSDEPYTLTILGSPDAVTNSTLFTEAATLVSGAYLASGSVSITTTYVTVQITNGSVTNTSMLITSTLS